MNIAQFVEELYSRASKTPEIDEFEIYHSEGDSFSIKIFEGEIDSYKNAKGLGISLRGIVRGKMGYSYTTKISPEVIDELISEVISNAGVLENRDRVEIFGGSPEYRKVENYRESFEEVTVAEKIAFAKMMEAFARSLDSRVAAVNYCLFQSGKGKKVIRNSKGLNLSSEGNSGAAYISVVVRDGEESKTGYAFQVGNDISKYNHVKLATIAVEKAVDKIGASPIETGKYPVLFMPEAFSSLLGAFSGIFSAEAVDKGVSLLKGKVGELIGSSMLTIVDNPFLEEGAASTGFDDEGVATEIKAVIDKGILKTYLHNIKTAEKFGVAPTGNGFKSSYAGAVGISPTNFYLEKGDKSFEQLINSEKKIVVITELAGLHSGLNSISGDFSLSAEGFYYENGEKRQAVNQITIAGNFFELLKRIEDLGDSVEFGMGSVGSPLVLVKELAVAGK